MGFRSMEYFFAGPFSGMPLAGVAWLQRTLILTVFCLYLLRRLVLTMLTGALILPVCLELDLSSTLSELDMEASMKFDKELKLQNPSSITVGRHMPPALVNYKVATSDYCFLITGWQCFWLVHIRSADCGDSLNFIQPLLMVSDANKYSIT